MGVQMKNRKQMELFVYLIGFAAICAQSFAIEKPRLLSLINIDRTYHIAETSDGVFIWNNLNIMYLKSGATELIRVELPSEYTPYILDLEVDGNFAYVLKERNIYRIDNGHNWTNMDTIPDSFNPRMIRTISGQIWVGGSKLGGPADLDRTPNTSMDVSGNLLQASITRFVSQKWVTIILPSVFGPVLEMRVCGSTLLVRNPYNAYVSYNQGVAWTPVTYPSGQSSTDDTVPTALYCLDARNLWIAYSDGTLGRDQGGKKWTEIVSASREIGVMSKIAFITSESGVALVDGKLWLTSDGGSTWKQLDLEEEVIDFAVGKDHTIDFITTSSLQRLQLPAGVQGPNIPK